MNIDATLLEACLAGDRRAFGQIVARHQAAVCAVAYSGTGDLALSQDLAQDTFITAWHRLGKLHNPEKLREWLCGIARNLAKDAMRRRKREMAKQTNSAAMDRAVPSPRDIAINKEESTLLWSVLESIPATYREPLILYYREGQSIKEVASALGLSEDAVSQRLSRGRKMLKEQVREFVENTLSQTGPRRDFGVIVLAALPMGLPSGVVANASLTQLFSWSKGLAIVAKLSVAGKMTILAAMLLLLSFTVVNLTNSPPEIVPPVVNTAPLSDTQTSEEYVSVKQTTEIVSETGVVAPVLETIPYRIYGSIRERLIERGPINSFPVADAQIEGRVMLQKGAGESTTFTATSDQDGNYSHWMDLVQGSSYSLEFVASADGKPIKTDNATRRLFPEGEIDQRSLNIGEKVVLDTSYQHDIYFDEEVRISGKVVNEGNRAIAHANVSATQSPPKHQLWRGKEMMRRGGSTQTTDVHGRFEMNVPFTWPKTVLDVRAPGYARALFPHIPVPSEDNRLMLQEPGATLFGVVSDTQGQPLPGATVECQMFYNIKEFESVEQGEQRISYSWRDSNEAIADDEGRYEFQSLVPGALYTVTAYPTGSFIHLAQTQARVELETDERRRLNLECGALSRITGRIYEVGTNEPVAARVIFLQFTERSLETDIDYDAFVRNIACEIWAETSPEGIYEAELPALGEYHVQVLRTRDPAWGRIQNLFETPSAGHTPLRPSGDITADFGLAPLLESVTLYAFDEKGMPLSGISLDLISMNNTPCGPAGLTNTNGKTVLKGIPPGKYYVQARLGYDVLSWSNPFVIEAGDDQIFEVTFPDLVYGKIRVQLPIGMSPEDMRIERDICGIVYPVRNYMPARDVTINTKNDITTFTCSLPEGNYTLEPPGRSPITFDILPDQTYYIDLSTQN